MLKMLTRTGLRLKRKLFSHPLLVRGLIVTVLVIGAGWLMVRGLLGWLAPHMTVATAQDYLDNFINPTTVLAQTDSRTNILVMGVGGAGHESPDLTDSMMVVSIDLETSEVLLLSLPRDLWIASLRAKLNTAYHYGQERQPNGGGFILAKSAVGEVLDQPIHYAVMLDFDGFRKIIDLLGGIDVNVETAFDDYKFPIPGKENAEPESDRYEHLRFESGVQYMDGDRALKFVRSRNAEGPEGTDIARSERQKKVILAIKDKVLATKVLFNQKTLKDLSEAVGQSLQTDIEDRLIPAFVRVGMNFHPDKLRSAALSIDLDYKSTSSASSSALLYHPEVSRTYDNQWVLAPSSGDFGQVHEYVKCLLSRIQECGGVNHE